MCRVAPCTVTLFPWHRADGFQRRLFVNLCMTSRMRERAEETVCLDMLGRQPFLFVIAGKRKLLPPVSGMVKVVFLSGFSLKTASCDCLQASKTGRTPHSKPSDRNFCMPSMASVESRATTLSAPNLPLPLYALSSARCWKSTCGSSWSSPPNKRRSEVLRSSVSLILREVTRAIHSTAQYTGPAKHKATAKNRSSWSRGTNTCCLLVLLCCFPLFQGARVQPRRPAASVPLAGRFLATKRDARAIIWENQPLEARRSDREMQQECTNLRTYQ